MSKHKSLKYQIRSRLNSLTRYGQSKHEAKKKEKRKPHGIFSLQTFKNYDRQLQLFATWAKERHNARELPELMKYADEYMEYRKSQGLSPYTLKLDKAAIQKCFEPERFKVTAELPSRLRKGITKNRTEIKGFNMEKHSDLVIFGENTGLRRSEVKDLRYKDIDFKTMEITVRKGKGGKRRVVTEIIDKDALRSILSPEGHDPEEHVFKSVPCRYPEHRFRRKYAQTLYERLARPISTLSQQDKYFCRADKKGTTYDREAMKVVSKQLGHNRVDVISISYL